MKRSAMPQRAKPMKRTEMKRGTSGLTRSGPIARKTPMPSPRIPAPRPASAPETPPKAKPAPSSQQERARAREAARRRAKAAAKKRAHGRCEHCGESTAGRVTHGHHRDPQGMGSTSDPAAQSEVNILHVIAEHHLEIELNREAALADGFLIEPGGDPACTPVRYQGGRWRLLDGAGGTAEVDAPADADARLLAVEVAEGRIVRSACHE